MSLVNSVRSYIDQFIQRIEGMETLCSSRLVVSHNLSGLENKFRTRMTLHLTGRTKNEPLTAEELVYVKRAWYSNLSALQKLYTLWQAQGEGMSFSDFAEQSHPTAVERAALVDVKSISPVILKHESARIHGNPVTSTLFKPTNRNDTVFAMFGEQLWFGTVLYFFHCVCGDTDRMMARINWHKTVGYQRNTKLPIFSTADEDLDTEDRFAFCDTLGGLALSVPDCLDHDERRIGVCTQHCDAFDLNEQI